jgi:hypothetical protein
MDPERLAAIFARVRGAYETLWGGPEAGEMDIGAWPELDDVHVAAVESDEFRAWLTCGRRLVVVDLGAGRGSRFARHLAPASPLLVAVDCFPSFARLEPACPAVKVVSDAFRCGLASGRADLVISAYLSLRNPLFRDPDLRQAYVGEILRLLRPGGLFWGEEPGLAPADFEGRPELADYYFMERCSLHTFRRAGPLPGTPQVR